MSGHQPQIEVASHHPHMSVDMAALRTALSASLPLCLEHALPGAPLAKLDEIEVSLVDDPTIADLHVRFMNVPGPTDVITFQHGEIIISVDTATRQAAEHGNPLDRELLLYGIHGLLHLAGYEDGEDSSRRRMELLQEQILERTAQV